MVVSLFLIVFAALFSYLYSLLNLGSLWFIILYIFLGIVSSLVFFVLLILGFAFVVKHSDSKKPFYHKVALQIIKFINMIARIKIEVIGKENIPTKTPFVIFPNHKSMLDVTIIYEAYHTVLTVVAKKNLMKVPVLRYLMTAFEVTPLDRENEREGVKALLKAISLVKEGYNTLIFPEGGIKSRDFETTVELKPGAFKLAVKPEAVISPVSIVNSSKLSKNAFKKKTLVKVIIHKPIYPEEYNRLNTQELSKNIKDIIDQGVIDYQNA